MIFRQTLRISVADPEAKAAYDRIASANFTKHACRATPKEQKPSHEGNIERLRNLVMRGMKPKDAVGGLPLYLT